MKRIILAGVAISAVIAVYVYYLASNSNSAE